jgi:hypothetical protein
MAPEKLRAAGSAFRTLRAGGKQAAERRRKISSLFRESGCYNDSDAFTYSLEMISEKEEYKNHEKDRA